MLSEEQIASKKTHVLEADSTIQGFYTLVAQDETTLELEHLFIGAGKLRRGYGSLLFHHACQVAREAKFQVLVIQCDPNAAGFYEALGVQLTREIPSSIPGRSIPYFEVNLRKL
ncbi:MAG: hypothetical protein H6R18_135 [Proteobacteria bacterium]|nr:hypothetical protein [Pseudomonadota bacterium]